jgi:hypothetical protein
MNFETLVQVMYFFIGFMFKNIDLKILEKIFDSRKIANMVVHTRRFRAASFFVNIINLATQPKEIQKKIFSRQNK